MLFYCLLCGKKKPIAEKTMQSHRKSDPCQKKRAGLASALASAKIEHPATCAPSNAVIDVCCLYERGSTKYMQKVSGHR